MRALNQYEGLRQQSCCPAFLIALTGTDLVIWGAVTAERFFFEPLAFIMLVPRPRRSARTAVEDKILEVANLLRALKEGVKELENHYSGVIRPLPIRLTKQAVGSRLITVPPSGLCTEAPTDSIPGMFPRWRKFTSESKVDLGGSKSENDEEWILDL